MRESKYIRGRYTNTTMAAANNFSVAPITGFGFGYDVIIEEYRVEMILLDSLGALKTIPFAGITVTPNGDGSIFNSSASTRGTYDPLVLPTTSNRLEWYGSPHDRGAVLENINVLATSGVTFALDVTIYTAIALNDQFIANLSLKYRLPD